MSYATGLAITLLSPGLSFRAQRGICCLPNELGKTKQQIPRGLKAARNDKIRVGGERTLLMQLLIAAEVAA
jgi:hypothetical protein